MDKRESLYVFDNLGLALRQFIDDFESGRTAQMKAAIRALFVVGFAVYDCSVSLRKLVEIFDQLKPKDEPIPPTETKES